MSLLNNYSSCRGGLTLTRYEVPTKNTLPLPSHLGREENIKQKAHGSRAGGGHSATTVTSKTGMTWRNHFFLIKSKLVNEKYTKFYQ